MLHCLIANESNKCIESLQNVRLITQKKDYERFLLFNILYSR